MSAPMFDLVLVGGSLSSALLAWRLVQSRPDVSFVLLQNRSTPSGTQTIWFRGTDVTKAQLEWLWVLCAKSFPSHDMERASAEPRRIGGAFHAIDLADLHDKVAELLGDRLRSNCDVREVHDTRVTLATGETIDARAVIDGRDVEGTPPWPHTFHELFHVEVQRGLEVPVMGLRKSTPRALPTGHEVPTFTRPIIGERVGLFHHTTGEALPMAVDLAEVIPSLPVDAALLTQWLKTHVQRHWDSQKFFRRLNARVRRDALFEKVHSHDDELIARFYAGTLSWAQELRLRFL